MIQELKTNLTIGDNGKSKSYNKPCKKGNYQRS